MEKHFFAAPDNEVLFPINFSYAKVKNRISKAEFRRVGFAISPKMKSSGAPGL
jgi:hypothetical protein